MHKKIKPQNSLFSRENEHKYSKELEIISKVLDSNPSVLDLVYADICKSKKDNGSQGMSAEQVLRTAIIKQRDELSYEALSYSLMDSLSVMRFCRMDYEERYSASCLQANIKKITEDTWTEINRTLILYACVEGIEKGRTVRVDSTVVESDIHHPTDSTLLHDCVNAICRILETARRELDDFNIYPKITVKNSKNLCLKILNSKNNEERLAHYKDLLRGCGKLLKQLPLCVSEISRMSSDVKLMALEIRLEEIKEQLTKIIYQTRERVLKGKTVPATEKIVSIFESHTDVIVKGRRETEFGHKIFLASGKSNMVLDCIIERGNPADSTQYLGLLKNQEDIFGKVPRQTTADGGFSSSANVEKAKSMGVKDVCFSKHCGLEIIDMVKSFSVFKKLRNFRAGVESMISALKRVFGLDRAKWKGYDGFCRYVMSNIVGYNLTVMARHIMAAS